MSTHRLSPSHGQQGHPGFAWERPLLVVTLILLAIVTTVIGWQLYEYFKPEETPGLMPTIPAATVPPVTRVPSLQISPQRGAEGTVITVHGEGWEPADTIQLCLDDLGDEGVPPVYSVTEVDENGAFLAAFSFPTQVEWQSLPDVAVVAESIYNEDKASAIFKLLAETGTPTPTITIPATATPSATTTAVTPTPTVPASPTATAIPPTPTCTYAMSFVADVTIPDDTIVLPGLGFVKTWRIRNSGNCPWPAGTSWVFAGGNQLGGPDAVNVAVTNPGETTDVSVYLVAPTTPGSYTSYWTLQLPGGQQLSERYYVRIIVPAPTPTATAIPPTPTPVPTAPAIYNWRGEYYNNTGLVGSPIVIRDDAAISFDWAEGVPAPGLPTDNFSVRWTRSLYFPGGSYRFFAASDDGVRIWLDNTLIVDEWHAYDGNTYMAELPITTGNHLVRVEYYEARGLANIQVWWQENASFSEWRGEYWSNRTLSGASTLVRNDSKIDFDWGTGAPAASLPADNFSVRWSRSPYFDGGHYRFTVTMDDGLRLYVDGTLLIDQWEDGAARTMSADIWLSAGRHDLRVDYYEHEGAAVARASWSRMEGITDWQGEYWANAEQNGVPALVRNDTTIDFNWGTGAPASGLPADNFSARWTRTINFPAGTYQLYIKVDDGMRLTIDTQLYRDEWHEHDASTTYVVRIYLEGNHTIVLDYYEDAGEAQVHFWYEKVSSTS
ncbi:MAG: hypothetical protein KDE59_17435 [Anaerolineales bacterium]|nr:hypothetical protein [Anaerolineales bacterium]